MKISWGNEEWKLSFVLFWLPYFFFFFFFFTLQYCIGFAIHQHASAMGVHMFSILLMHIYGIYKDDNDNPVCETARETQMYRTVFWTLWHRLNFIASFFSFVQTSFRESG